MDLWNVEFRREGLQATCEGIPQRLVNRNCWAWAKRACPIGLGGEVHSREQTTNEGKAVLTMTQD